MQFDMVQTFRSKIFRVLNFADAILFQGRVYGEMAYYEENEFTINILNWLESNGWGNYCYDFPSKLSGSFYSSISWMKTEQQKQGDNS